ncbi:MAG: ParB/RepB/Spo0J family partition protein [Bacilli bacterium]|nr:ParB/RepB/Spo0J family partition protein [Bacilli bacterium]MDY6430525.1 ParB/RepB/Spo0J family partition protein [Bacilli bacterium]
MSVKNKTLSIDLEQLIEKFSQENVVDEIEKEYQSSPSKLVPLSLLEDTQFIKNVLISAKTVDFYANGIKERGVFNPLVVRPKNDKFEVVLGRRRLYGAKKNGLLTVPCVIADITDEQVLLMLLADNRDEKDRNVIEMATVYEHLINDFNYSKETLAQLSHCSRSQVVNQLRILSLSPKVQKAVSDKKLSYGHARALIGLDEENANFVLNKIYDEDISVRETEELVRNLKGQHEDTDPKVKRINNKIVISYSSIEEAEDKLLKVRDFIESDY